MTGRSWISSAAASGGAVLPSARHMITAPSTAAMTKSASRCPRSSSSRAGGSGSPPR